MNDQEKQNPESSPNNSAQAAMDKLIQLNEKAKMQTAPDLNSRLGDIESELKHLNARESATNKSFRELLSETRKHSANQTAELDQAREKIAVMSDQYKKMTQDYQRLAASANILSANLEQARSEFTNDLSEMKLSTNERLDELAEGQLQMIERANRIEDRATQMARDIDSRINVIRTTIEALETRIMAEIREVAEQSEQRDEALTIRTDMIEENFNHEVARVREAHTNLVNLLDDKVAELQQIDAELADRALTLEVETVALKDKTEDLQLQNNILDSRTTDLEERSDELESVTARQATVLGGISDTIDRHHKGFAVALVLIAATFGIISYLQQDRWVATTEADQALQQVNDAQSVAQAENTSRITALETQSKADDSKLAVSIDQHEKQLEAIAASIQTLKEKTENSDQRLNAMNPFRTFGKDNTIRTSSWLDAQNKELYVVEVFSADSKRALYEAAYRFSNLMDENNLSYVEKEISGRMVYTLVYGPFEDMQSAETASRRLPVINRHSRPVAKKLSETF